jgi:TonB family protein
VSGFERRVSGMKSLVAACVVMFSVGGFAAVAQEPVAGRSPTMNTEAAISAQLIGKPLLLRGFWVEDELKFDDAGLPASEYPVGSFTEAGFDAQKVTLKSDHLTITGQRVALVFDAAGNARRVPMTRSKMFSKSPERVTIEIDGHGDGDFDKELNAIFADRLSDIASSLPDYWQPFATRHSADSTETLEAMPSFPTKQDAKASHVGGNVKPPKLLKSVDPKFSETARQQKFSGNVEIYLWVGEDGLPSHIRIVRPVGMGLDERAVAAISQYRFAPATRDGQPVMVDLYVDVNFRIF